MTSPALHPRTLSLLALAVLSSLSFNTYADEEASDEPEERIVTIGTRMSGRTTTETAAPVDIISNESIRNAGITDTGELLRTLAPSFNMNNTTTSDGQDLMRPATLRSLGPDQVLVLVNGKRRHQQAIVAVQQNVGRGNAGTDMNAIPITAIDRVEVLRDGAAAQYGSDAIAGVINIILKDDTGTRAWAHYGRTDEGEANKQIGVNSGFSLGEAGVFNVSIEWQDKDEINRAAESNWYGASPVTRQLLLVGEAAVEAEQLWFNASRPTDDGELYAFGGFGKREAESLGFFRHIYNNRQLASVYPQGITPKLGTQSEDSSWAVGYKTDFDSGWSMDLSLTTGKNRFEFRNLQSLNVSYGNNTPTEAYDGALVFKQDTFNLDFTGTVDWGIGKDELAVAFGLERRFDGYEIHAGDEVSYARGTDVGFPGAIDCHPLATSCDPSDVDDPDDPNDTFFLGTPPGMQGFQGYRPEHEIDTTRNSNALYVDTEAYWTDNFSSSLALRYEDYSDFGSTTNGKLAARWQVADAFALRGSFSTGFRAPGMQQQYFTQRSISLGAGGQLQDLVTLRPGSALANELGFDALKEETSQSASFGFVYNGEIWTTTFDIYQIDIDDRIVYSQAIGAGLNAATADFFARHAAENLGGDGLLDGVASVEVFTNAADTRTRGFDWVNLWRLDDWLIEFTVHMNDTDIQQVNSSSSIVPDSAVVDDGIRNLIEDAQPGERGSLSGSWNPGAFSTTVRATYYGEYSDHTRVYGLPKHTFDAQTLVDWTVRFDFTESFRLSGGILNLFDEYPSKWGEGALASDGTDYSVLGFTYGWNTIPFSLAGRQYFLRGEVTF